MSDREQLEIAEARELAYSYRVHKREKGEEFAREWVAKALAVTRRRFKKGYREEGADEGVRFHMRRDMQEHESFINQKGNDDSSNDR
jgi:hypothetical protein